MTQSTDRPQDRTAEHDLVLGRRPLLGAGFAVAATAFVSACGSSDDDASAGSTGSAPSSSSSSSSSSAAGASLAKVADVPVGGAISAKAPDGKAILITQPTAGTIVAFSAKCTHMGCTVAPGDKELDCPCHGSVYDLNGKNVRGPAPRPLTAFPVTVKDGEVVAS